MSGYATGWPYVPGLEVSGTVREVGSGFTTHNLSLIDMHRPSNAPAYRSGQT